MIILDTNVVSEIIKPQPEPAVAAWFRLQSSHDLATTIVTFFEIEYGIVLLAASNRKRLLSAIVNDLFAEKAFGPILPFEEEDARHAAAFRAERRSRGREVALADSWIAGIALRRGCAIATRNRRDFEHASLEVVDPWEGKTQ